MYSEIVRTTGELNEIDNRVRKIYQKAMKIERGRQRESGSGVL